MTVKFQVNDLLIPIYLSTLSCRRTKDCLCLSLGLFISHRGEVCRHSEGQGAEAHGPTAAAADAATQCCFHVGKSHWAQQPGATVPSSESLVVFMQNVMICLFTKQFHQFKLGCHFHFSMLFLLLGLALLTVAAAVSLHRECT